jgi:hypothetical protein
VACGQQRWSWACCRCCCKEPQQGLQGTPALSLHCLQSPPAHTAIDTLWPPPAGLDAKLAIRLVAVEGILPLDLLLALQQWLHHDACKPGARVCWIRPGVCASAAGAVSCRTANCCLKADCCWCILPEAASCCVVVGMHHSMSMFGGPAAAIAWSCAPPRCCTMHEHVPVPTRAYAYYTGRSYEAQCKHKTPLPICRGLAARPTCLCSARADCRLQPEKEGDAVAWRGYVASCGQGRFRMWRLSLSTGPCLWSYLQPALYTAISTSTLL